MPISPAEVQQEQPLMPMCCLGGTAPSLGGACSLDDATDDGAGTPRCIGPTTCAIQRCCTRTTWGLWLPPMCSRPPQVHKLPSGPATGSCSSSAACDIAALAQLRFTCACDWMVSAGALRGAGDRFVSARVRAGVLPTILKALIEARKAAREELKGAAEADRRAVLDSRQKALKVEYLWRRPPQCTATTGTPDSESAVARSFCNPWRGPVRGEWERGGGRGVRIDWVWRLRSWWPTPCTASPAHRRRRCSACLWRTAASPWAPHPCAPPLPPCTPPRSQVPRPPPPAPPCTDAHACPRAPERAAV